MSKSHQFDELVSAAQYDELFLAKKDYNEHHDTGKYIKTCAHLLKDIIRKSGHKILFYNLYGYDYEIEKYISLSNYDREFYDWNNFDSHISDCFKNGLKAIQDGNMLSISSKIVANKINFVLLCNDKDEIAKFKKHFKNSAGFCLDNYSANLEISDPFDTAMDNRITGKQATLNEQAIEKFASELFLENAEDNKNLRINIRYQIITFKQHESFYIYYIRPRAFHEEFIGSLYLVLANKLSFVTLNQLSAFILEIFSETAIWRIKKIINQDLLPTFSGDWKKEFVNRAFIELLRTPARRKGINEKSHKLTNDFIEWVIPFYTAKEAHIPSHGYQDYRLTKYNSTVNIGDKKFKDTFDNNIILRITLTAVCKFCADPGNKPAYVRGTISQHIINYFVQYIRNSGKDINYHTVEENIIGDHDRQFFNHLGLSKTSNKQMIREEKLSPFEKKITNEIVQAMLQEKISAS